MSGPSQIIVEAPLEDKSWNKSQRLALTIYIYVFISFFPQWHFFKEELMWQTFLQTAISLFPFSVGTFLKISAFWHPSQLFFLPCYKRTSPIHTLFLLITPHFLPGLSSQFVKLQFSSRYWEASHLFFTTERRNIIIASECMVCQQGTSHLILFITGCLKLSFPTSSHIWIFSTYNSPKLWSSSRYHLSTWQLFLELCNSSSAKIFCCLSLHGYCVGVSPHAQWHH